MMLIPTPQVRVIGRVAGPPLGGTAQNKSSLESVWRVQPGCIQMQAAGVWLSAGKQAVLANEILTESSEYLSVGSPVSQGCCLSQQSPPQRTAPELGATEGEVGAGHSALFTCRNQGRPGVQGKGRCWEPQMVGAPWLWNLFFNRSRRPQKPSS